MARPEDLSDRQEGGSRPGRRPEKCDRNPGRHGDTANGWKLGWMPQTLAVLGSLKLGQKAGAPLPSGAPVTSEAAEHSGSACPGRPGSVRLFASGGCLGDAVVDRDFIQPEADHAVVGSQCQGLREVLEGHPVRDAAVAVPWMAGGANPSRDGSSAANWPHSALSRQDGRASSSRPELGVRHRVRARCVIGRRC